MTHKQKLTIPTGNTLICLPLNFDCPIKPEILECKSVEDVFFHIRPSCVINFSSNSKNTVEEKLCFNSLADFNVMGICTNSVVLSDLIDETILYFDNANVITPVEFNEKVSFILSYAEITEESELVSCLKLLKNNLVNAIKIISPIEKSYLELNLFFKNRAAEGKAFVLDAWDEQLSDLDNPRFIDHIDQFLRQHFDRLDMRNAISCLVIPGFLDNYFVLRKFVRICSRHAVVLFTDLRTFDIGVAEIYSFNFTTRNSNSKQFDFSDFTFENVCFTGDHLFINPPYSFLHFVTAKVSFSTVVAALTPSFLLRNPVVTINLGDIPDGVRIIKNNGKYKAFFNSFAVEKKGDGYCIAGNRTLYQGSLYSLKSIKLVFLFYWLLKRFAQMVSLTVIDEIEINPPGTLLSLQKNFRKKIATGFYELCKTAEPIIDSNIEWLTVAPDWLPVNHRNHEISYLWPYSFTLIMKLKERVTDDSLLMMHIRLFGDGYHNAISNDFDIIYEEVNEEELINFTNKM